MKLVNKRNGKMLKLGSTVQYNGERCWLIGMTPEKGHVEVENQDGMSWDLIEAEDVGCVWKK